MSNHDTPTKAGGSLLRAPTLPPMAVDVLLVFLACERDRLSKRIEEIDRQLAALQASKERGEK